MKQFKWFFVLMISLFVVSSCDDIIEDNEVLESKEIEITIDSDGDTVSIDTEYNRSWYVKVSESWCEIDKEVGSERSTLRITLDANEGAERSAVIEIYYEDYDDPQRIIYITQESKFVALPVVFHVLYRSGVAEDKVSSSRIDEIIENVNEYLLDNKYGADLGIYLTLVESDDDGIELDDKGLNYVQYSKLPMDPADFLGNRSVIDDFPNLIWDPNGVINIYLAPFDLDTYLGVSPLPITAKGGNELDGISALDFSEYGGDEYSILSGESIDYPYGLVINTTHIDVDNETIGYNTPENINATIAHELGHYLGLLHPFISNDEPINSDGDSDYCKDTPVYNRDTYEEYVTTTEGISIGEALMRTAIDGTTFESTNMMDYNYSQSDRFTEDQKERILHILEHGLLLPTKRNNVNTRSAGVVVQSSDIPLRLIK